MHVRYHRTVLRFVLSTPPHEFSPQRRVSPFYYVSPQKGVSPFYVVISHRGYPPFMTSSQIGYPLIMTSTHRGILSTYAIHPQFVRLTLLLAAGDVTIPRLLLAPILNYFASTTQPVHTHDRTENACTVSISLCLIQSLRKLF